MYLTSAQSGVSINGILTKMTDVKVIPCHFLSILKIVFSLADSIAFVLNEKPFPLLSSLQVLLKIKAGIDGKP